MALPSVDVEDGLAADAALQQRIQGCCGLTPGALKLDLAVEPPVGDQPAQPLKIPGRAGVLGELIEQVEGVDPRAGRTVEPRRAEDDRLLRLLGREIDHHAVGG
jgi:hypothetical protein